MKLLTLNYICITSTDIKEALVFLAAGLSIIGQFCFAVFVIATISTLLIRPDTTANPIFTFTVTFASYSVWVSISSPSWAASTGAAFALVFKTLLSRRAICIGTASSTFLVISAPFSVQLAWHGQNHSQPPFLHHFPSALPSTPPPPPPPHPPHTNF